MPAAVGQRRPLTQAQRLLTALVYMGGFLVLAVYLNGQLVPPFGLSGLWFYSALAALVLGEFLIEPFFTRPADAIANAIAVLITVASVETAHARVSQVAVNAGRYAFIAYALVVLVLAITAVVAKGRTDRIGVLGRVAFQASGVLGRSTAIFSLLLFASGYAAFADDSGKVATLYLSWILVSVAHPVEFAIRSTGLLRPSALRGQLVVEEIRAAAAWEKDLRATPPSFAENLAALEERVAAFWLDAGKRVRGEVVVVAHRGSLAVLRALITGAPFQAMFADGMDLGTTMWVAPRLGRSPERFSVHREAVRGGRWWPGSM